MIPVRIIPTIPPQMSIVLFIIACREEIALTLEVRTVYPPIRLINWLPVHPVLSSRHSWTVIPMFTHVSNKSSGINVFFLIPTRRASTHLVCMYSVTVSILLTTGIPSINSFSSGSRSASTIPTISNSLNTFCSTRFNMESISSLVETRSIFIFE